MKIARVISLLFIILILLFGIGFYLGGLSSDFFYPGKQAVPLKQESKSFLITKPVAKSEEQIIDVNTKFVFEEYDLKRNTCIKTESKTISKYIGLNRTEFLDAMDEYELSPPLSELERGFVSLEVKSFSKSKILIRMNYLYKEPSHFFYILVEKNNIMVYCEDKKTIYMKTNIKLENLPDTMQQQIISGMYIKNERDLYDFLENYSS